MNSLSPSAIASKLESTKNALFTEENKEKAKKFAEDIKNELLRTEDELKMQKILDLLKGRIVWSKNYWTDFWYNLRNNHPLIGCFLADPVHPFSRGERMVVLAMSLGVAYIITVIGVLFTPEEGFTKQQVLVGIIISSLIQTIVDGILVAAAKCSCCYGPSIPVAVTKFFEVQGKLSSPFLPIPFLQFRITFCELSHCFLVSITWIIVRVEYLVSILEQYLYRLLNGR